MKLQGNVWEQMANIMNNTWHDITGYLGLQQPVHNFINL